MSKSSSGPPSVRYDFMRNSPDRPLDELLPGLKEPPLPNHAVHQRILERVTDEGIEWVLIVRRDPGGQRLLHREVQNLVEATLLIELSRRPAVLKKKPKRKYAAFRLIVMPSFDWELEPAVRAFGFTRDSQGPDDELMRVVGDELKRLGDPVRAPSAVYTVRIQYPEGELGTRMDEMNDKLIEALDGESWGVTPGEFSHRFAFLSQHYFGRPIRATMDGIRMTDRLLVQKKTGVIRWIPPMVFQALCDFLPVVATAVHEARVAWAVSEDIDEEVTHPPLIRADANGDEIHIPIGIHVLRWWMMPLGPGDEVPSMDAWLDDQFGPSESSPA